MFDPAKFIECLRTGPLKTAVRLAVQKAGGRCGEFQAGPLGLTVDLLDDAGKPFERLWLGSVGLSFVAGVRVFHAPGGSILVDGRQIDCRDYAAELLEKMQAGAFLVLPSERDEGGEYLWDFRIEGGPADQVEVRRQGEDVAAVKKDVRRAEAFGDGMKAGMLIGAAVHEHDPRVLEKDTRVQQSVNEAGLRVIRTRCRLKVAHGCDCKEFIGHATPLPRHGFLRKVGISQEVFKQVLCVECVDTELPPPLPRET